MFILIMGKDRFLILQTLSHARAMIQIPIKQGDGRNYDMKRELCAVGKGHADDMAYRFYGIMESLLHCWALAVIFRRLVQKKKIGSVFLMFKVKYDNEEKAPSNVGYTL